MFTLIVAAIIILAVVVIGSMMDWIVHISMVKEQTTQYGWAGHKKFIEQFHKAEWEYQPYWRKSLFGKEYEKDQYHANIFKFNSKGMIINNPVSYLIVKLYVSGYIKETYNNGKTDEWR